MSELDYTPEEARALDLARRHMACAVMEIRWAVGHLLDVDRFGPGRRHLKPTVSHAMHALALAEACEKDIHEEVFYG